MEKHNANDDHRLTPRVSEMGLRPPTRLLDHLPPCRWLRAGGVCEASSTRHTELAGKGGLGKVLDQQGAVLDGDNWALH